MTGDRLMVKGMAIPVSEIEETFHTSGGPGGQHANRSETAVRIRFSIPESSLPADVKERLISTLGQVVVVTASEERSQWRNREIARQRLVDRLERGLVRKKRRKKTRRTRAADETRLEKKRKRSEKKRMRRRPRIDE